jgi:hypothetical protein
MPMKNAMIFLEPELQARYEEVQRDGKVVIGTLKTRHTRDRQITGGNPSVMQRVRGLRPRFGCAQGSIC